MVTKSQDYFLAFVHVSKAISSTLNLQEVLDFIVKEAIRAGGPVIVPDIEHDDQLQYPEECKREGIRSILSVPIIFKDETIGVLAPLNPKFI